MKSLLSSSAFLVLNKKLAQALGLKEAILLSDLISKEEYFLQNGMIDGWFFNTEDNIQQDTTLTPYQQRKALKTLKNKQILEIKRMGIPAKQFFKINEEQVIKFLNNKTLKKSTTNNKNKTIKTNNKLFKKPTVEEIEIYCKERNNKVNSSAFFDFYESKGWKVGKNSMKDWKASVRTWERREQKPTYKTSKIESQINEYLKGKELL